MAAIEVGTICMKARGREAGRKVVVVGFDKNLAIIDGPKVKKRKCNIMHLFPTGEKIKIGKGAKHADVIKLMK